MSEGEPKASRTDAPVENLPALVGRLGEDLAVLVDSKLSLLRIELREETRSYIRGGGLVALGGLVATVGLGLVSAAAALVLSTFLRGAFDLSLPAACSLGLAVVGAVVMVGGGIGARRAAQRLIATESTPKIEKDREWLRPGNS